MFIACNTSGEEGCPQFAIIDLTPEIAAQLLKFRTAFERARKVSGGLYCVEFLDSRVRWGDTELNIGDEWARVTSEDAVDDGDGNRPCAETIRATSSGVRWCASSEHSDRSFETEELAWSDLEAVAAGNNPFTILKE